MWDKIDYASLSRIHSLNVVYRQIECSFDILNECRKGKFKRFFETISTNESFEDWPWPLYYSPYSPPTVPVTAMSKPL